MVTADEELPRIYVASLSDYNTGALHGCWITIDDTTTTEEVWDEINAMLAASAQPGAEEHAIHDVDNFGGWDVSEHEPIETVTAVGRFMATHDRYAVAAWLDNHGRTAVEELPTFEDDYVGTVDSERAFAVDHIDGSGWSGLTADQLDKVWNYLDFFAIENALFRGDYWSAPNPAGGAFVFRNS